MYVYIDTERFIVFISSSYLNVVVDLDPKLASQARVDVGFSYTKSGKVKKIRSGRRPRNLSEILTPQGTKVHTGSRCQVRLLEQLLRPAPCN